MAIARPALRTGRLGQLWHPDRQLRERLIAYLMLAPACLLVLGVLAYPLLWQLVMSLTDTNVRTAGLGQFVDIQNYLLLAGDPIFWLAVRTTLVYTLVTTALKVALGVPIALFLARPFRGRSLVFLAVFLPWV